MIDGLNVSNWESDAVFERLRAGNITAVNATVATWENFLQTMDHLSAWMRRFCERDDILQVKETADIHAAKKARQDRDHPRFPERLADRERPRPPRAVPRPRGAG